MGSGQGNLLVSAEVLDLTSNRWNPVADDQIYRIVINESARITCKNCPELAAADAALCEQ